MRKFLHFGPAIQGQGSTSCCPCPATWNPRFLRWEAQTEHDQVCWAAGHFVCLLQRPVSSGCWTDWLGGGLGLWASGPRSRAPCLLSPYFFPLLCFQSPGAESHLLTRGPEQKTPLVSCRLCLLPNVGRAGVCLQSHFFSLCWSPLAEQIPGRVWVDLQIS